MILPRVQYAAYFIALFLDPKIKVINKRSGGIGKKIASDKANINKAKKEYLLLDNDNIQLYNFIDNSFISFIYFSYILSNIINFKNK